MLYLLSLLLDQLPARAEAGWSHMLRYNVIQLPCDELIANNGVSMHLAPALDVLHLIRVLSPAEPAAPPRLPAQAGVGWDNKAGAAARRRGW